MSPKKKQKNYILEFPLGFWDTNYTRKRTGFSVNQLNILIREGFFSSILKHRGRWYIHMDEVRKVEDQIRRHGLKCVWKFREPKPTAFTESLKEQRRHEETIKKIKSGEYRQNILAKLLEKE